MKDLRNRVCVVTGAAYGVGAALAQSFAERGARLVLCDVEEEALRESATRLPKGVEVLLQRTDVSRSDEVDALARAAVERFGAVHVVCNNAGVAMMGTSWGTSLEDWRRIFAVNVMGVVHGLRSFVPILLEQGEEAHIVTICSLSGLVSAPMHATYSASKHAVLALTETLRDELAGTGKPIGVSLVCPGPIRTNMINTTHATPGTPEAAALEALKQHVREQGMDASEVARHTLDAVLANRFWVIPAPHYFDAEYPRIQQVRAALGAA